MKRLVLGAALLLASAGMAFAGDVDLRKSRDTHVTIWHTLLGFRVGDPVYDGDLAAGDRLRVKSSWVTDLSVEQTFLATARFTQTDFAALEPAGGLVNMAFLDDYVRDTFGQFVPTYSDFAPVSAPEVYVTVDIAVAEPYALEVGTLLFVEFGEVLPQDGAPDGLPGVQFGLAPFTFAPTTGWITPVPYVGLVEVVGEIGLNAGLRGCNVADIAQPAGVLDIDDVLMFLDEFAGGCP